jgi:c(7)-type cytochrome triheme protein
MKTTRKNATVVALVGAALLTGTALGQALPKLPGELALPQSGDSPGKVLFRHETHVDEKAADCTTCHPKMFRINESGKTAAGVPVTHEAMKKGEYCGACHNEKKAFGLESCENCHTN